MGLAALWRRGDVVVRRSSPSVETCRGRERQLRLSNSYAGLIAQGTMSVFANPLPKQRRRLAVVLSHPIQYFSPWFAHIAATEEIDLRVFYLWNFGVQPLYDREFAQSVQWDIPLLEGYESEFVPNRSSDPGTHHVLGLDNPTVVDRLAAWSPDAILLFGYTYAAHLRILFSRRLRNIPFLLRGDSHDLFRNADWKAPLVRLGRRRLFRKFAAFLAVGVANADYYRNSGVPAPRIHFVPHCVDNHRFQAAAHDALSSAAAWKRELGIPEESTVVLFAGKLEAQKSPIDLLDAFAKAKGNSHAVLLFVGSGPLETEIKAKAGDRIGRDVFFAPFQNQSRMPMVYAAGNLLVLPSQEETWGLAANEAMNLERPVIVSSRVGCGPDLIKTGETGWIFEAGDVDALATTLATALREPRRLREMGCAARHHIDHYSYDIATNGLLRVLRELQSEP